MCPTKKRSNASRRCADALPEEKSMLAGGSAEKARPRLGHATVSITLDTAATPSRRCRKRRRR
jgi:hypothetical protein